jgi:hypothetical protein
MKKLITILLGCIFLGGKAVAAELSDSHTKLLKESDIPLSKDT